MEHKHKLILLTVLLGTCGPMSSLWSSLSTLNQLSLSFSLSARSNIECLVPGGDISDVTTYEVKVEYECNIV